MLTNAWARLVGMAIKPRGPACMTNTHLVKVRNLPVHGKALLRFPPPEQMVGSDRVAGDRYRSPLPTPPISSSLRSRVRGLFQRRHWIDRR